MQVARRRWRKWLWVMLALVIGLVGCQEDKPLPPTPTPMPTPILLTATPTVRPAPTATASANLNVKLENTLGTGWTHGEVVWSPDSRFAAVTFWADTLAQTYVVDSRTGESFELTTDEGNVGLVAWSPDGKRIAGVSGGDMDSERQGIWSFAGGYITKLLGGVCEDLAWSPDGNTLVATCELVVRESCGARLSSPSKQ